MVSVKVALLKEKFTVLGKFEKVKVAGDPIWLRSEARIVRRDSDMMNKSSPQRANAVIVMMKPGNSVPISNQQTGEWTEAKVDRTHIQLMRLMERLSWNEIKIVHLSDFCEANYIKFLELIKRSEHGDIEHSRFTSNSPSEWSDVILSGDRLLYGWGEKREATEMANSYGLLDLDDMYATYGKQPVAVWDPLKGYPRHPNSLLPERCEAWLDEMVEALNK